MIRRSGLSLAILALLAAAAPARADESPRKGTFEFRTSHYAPDVDSEFGGRAAPYADAFGRGKTWMWRFELTRSVFKTYGTFDVGLGTGYFQQNGNGRLADGTPSADRTTFRIIPVDLSVTYRLDVLPNGFVMPIMPYVRASLERYNWWTTGAGTGPSVANGKKGRGATHGYSLSAGAAFLLDILDRGLAREMDNDLGINHTYVFFDVTKSTIDDFGSSSSINLSNTGALALGGGLMFVY